MAEELNATGTSRVRMNVSTTAKGAAQWEVTAEFSTPEEAAKHLNEGITKVREVIKSQGLIEAGAAG